MAWYGQTVWLEHWERSWGDALLFCVAIYSPVQRNLALWLSVRCGELFQEHWCNHREAGCPSDHFGKASAPRLNDIVSVAWPDGQLGYSLIQHTHKHCQQRRYGPHTHAHWEGQPRCWNWFSSHPFLSANACHPLPGLGAWMAGSGSGPWCGWRCKGLPPVPMSWKGWTWTSDTFGCWTRQTVPLPLEKWQCMDCCSICCGWRSGDGLQSSADAGIVAPTAAWVGFNSEGIIGERACDWSQNPGLSDLNDLQMKQR